MKNQAQIKEGNLGKKVNGKKLENMDGSTEIIMRQHKQFLRAWFLDTDNPGMILLLVREKSKSNRLRWLRTAALSSGMRKVSKLYYKAN